MKPSPILALLLLLDTVSCARRDAAPPAPGGAREPRSIPVIETRSLPMPTPAGDSLPAAVLSLRVRLALVDVAPRREELPLPAADAAQPPPGGAPSAVPNDAGLQPPIARTSARFTRPPSAARGPHRVSLDVRVDAAGVVSDVLWAGGSEDSALVAVATEAAFGMRYFPAQLDGRPVAVWCRQRLELER